MSSSFYRMLYIVVNSLSDAMFFSVMVSSPFTSVLSLIGGGGESPGPFIKNNNNNDNNVF